MHKVEDVSIQPALSAQAGIDSMNDNNDKKVKILFIIPSFRVGGAEIQLLTLLKGIDKNRFEPFVAVFYSDKGLDPFFNKITGIKIFYLKKNRAFDFQSILKLHKLIKKYNFQIIQAFNISARLLGFILAKVNTVPVTILTERSANLLYTSLGSRFYLFFEKYALRYASLVVANSYAGRKFLLSRGVPSNSIKVIYNGLDPERLCVRRSKEEILEQFYLQRASHVVAFVARLEEQKDPLTFLQAAKKISETHTTTFFLYIGDGPLTSLVKKYAEDWSIADKIIFTGYQNNVADFWQIIDILAVTSQKVEGCSNVILEAMTFGKPVVATDVGGNSEIVKNGKTGFLVPSKDSSSLAEKIILLLNDKILYGQISTAAKEEALVRFSSERMVSSYETLYNDLLKQNRMNRNKKVDMNMETQNKNGRANVLGFDVDKMTLESCVLRLEEAISLRQVKHIVLVNAAKLVKARYDIELANIIRHADLVGADGVPVVWASKLFGDALPGRVNGTDLMERLIEEAAKKEYRIFFLGAQEEVITKAIENLKEQYPGLKIAGYRNGYFNSQEDEEETVQKISASNADILFVGMGSPMKEKWVRKYINNLSVPVIHGVGGSFDILGGLTKRAPVWMQRYGMEWLYRVYLEPKRLWKRYLITNTYYVVLVAKEMVVKRINNKNSNNGKFKKQ